MGNANIGTDGSDPGVAVLEPPAAHSLIQVQQATHVPVPLTDAMQWFNEPLGQFVDGGIYLLAGPPGTRKSGLGLQVSLDLAKQGIKCLHILTEEPACRLKERALRMTSEWESADVGVAMSNLLTETSLPDVEALPSFFVQHVLSAHGRCHGVKLIVLDSIQGNGLPSGALKKYAKLYEFTRLCQAAGITTLLIGHVTKTGAIQGPRDLEHNVDAVIQLRKAMRFRALAVPKNRFGPAVMHPLALELDDVTTNLYVSPHAEPVTTVARTCLVAGAATHPVASIAEIQCSVAMPSFGCSGKVMAPGLPPYEILQLLATIGQIPGMELGEMDFSIHARMPGERRYRDILGLPLAVAMIASYLQRPIPEGNIYFGEVDLRRHVRALPDVAHDVLVAAEPAMGVLAGRKVYCNPTTATRLANEAGLNTVACEKLDDAIHATWPDLG